MFCNPFATRKRPLNLEPTTIKYPKNDLGILYYSKDNNSYEAVLNNFEKLTLYYPDKITNKISPKYPLELMGDNELERKVVLKVHINKSGLVRAIIIIKSGGEYLDNNCIDAVKNWVFGAYNNSPYYCTIPFTFKSK